ncbi:MAG: FecR family protein [Bacteroidales bacterium]|nr:FecR family protein [Bacteroidales bacterium]
MEKKLPWDLIISKLKNNLLPEQSKKIEKWLSQGENAKLFLEIKNFWEELREEASGYEPDMVKRWDELSSRLNFEKSDRYRELNKSQRKTTPFWKRVAAAAVVLIAISAGYFASSVIDNRTPTVISHSAMNGKSVVNLPDGTLVWLHNNTTLSYDSRFGDKTRELTLTGEAYFEVAHDSRHPFIVKANDLTVQVYGTKFNLRNRKEEDMITVSLLEGSVSVESGRKITMLKPGFEALYN